MVAGLALGLVACAWLFAEGGSGYIHVMGARPDARIRLQGPWIDREIRADGWQEVPPGILAVSAEKDGRVFFTEDHRIQPGIGAEVFIPAVYRHVFGGAGWKQLYNGRNSDGWQNDGHSNAETGELVLFSCSNLDTVEKLPRNFHLCMEVKLVAGAAGVCFHAPPPGKKPRLRNDGLTPSWHTPEDGWSVTISDSEDRDKINLSLVVHDGPGREITLRSEGKSYPTLNQWFYLEIIAKDDSAAIVINGREQIGFTIASSPTAELHEDQYFFFNGPGGDRAERKLTLRTPPAAGVLSLWMLGVQFPRRHEAQIAFRNIEVKELTPPSPKTPPLADAPFDAAKAKEHQEAWAKHLGVDVETTNSIAMKLRLIPPGQFLMGSPDDEVGREAQEGPEHEVVITRPFRMGVHDVTVGQFKAFVKEKGYKTQAEKTGGAWRPFPDGYWKQDPQVNWHNPNFEQTDDHPVVCVSWHDAKAFCDWLSEKEGKNYGLPTEAQWEYACRAGSNTKFYFGGDDQYLGEYGWYSANSMGKPNPVGQKKPNAWGLYDLGGNVSQWTADWLRTDYYQQSPKEDPPGPKAGGTRALRGSNWWDGARFARAAFRHGSDFWLPWKGCTGTGFRIIQIGDLRTKTPPDKPGWVPLFNGKDLTGWNQKKGETHWRVVNDILTGSANKSVVVLPTLRKDFANFRLRAEVRLQSDQRGEGSGAIVFRGVYRADIYETTAGSLALKQDMAWLDHRPNALSKEGEWFLLEIAADGARLTTKINGKPVADVNDATSGSGRFALELDPKLGRSKVEFRKIEIKELPPEYKNDKERLQGRWVAESIETDGEQRPQEIVTRTTWTVSGNKIKMTPVIARQREAIFHLDDSAYPKKIDVIDDDNKGGFGIYRFDGDRFVLCIDDVREKDRPTKFSSKGGKNRTLVVFKRAAPEEAGWVPLFNGKDLAGWKKHRLNPESWTVENGELVRRGDKSFLFTDKGDFRSFHLRAEVKTSGKANGGIDFGVPLGLDGQWLKSGYQVPLGFLAGSLKRLGGEYKTLHQAPAKMHEPDAWFVMEVIVKNNHVQTLVNGKIAANYHEPAFSPPTGHIVLQWAPAKLATEGDEMRFRRIEIKELPPEETGWTPLFNGKDLAGWKEQPPSGLWKVQDGLLIGPDKESTLYAAREFRDFHCRIEAKASADFQGNFGFWYRQPWGSRVILGNPMRDKEYRGTLRCIGANGIGEFVARQEKEVAPPDSWFNLEVIAKGHHLTVLLNGVKTFDATVDSLRTDGQIYLYAEKGVIQFRNIEIKELPPDAKTKK